MKKKLEEIRTYVVFKEAQSAGEFTSSKGRPQTKTAISNLVAGGILL